MTWPDHRIPIEEVYIVLAHPDPMAVSYRHENLTRSQDPQRVEL